MNIRQIGYQISVITIVISLIVGFISTNFMSSYKTMYMLEINNLRTEVSDLKHQIESNRKLNDEIIVDVTMCRPNEIECDYDPDITADGTKLHIPQASRYRYVALSRNLLKRWGGQFNYGDYIVIQGTSDKDGIYQVRDTMNEKFRNVVDILESHGVRPYKYENVKLYKLAIG